MQISSFSLPLNPLWSYSKVRNERYSSCKIYIIHINCFWWRWVGWTAIPAVNTLITSPQQQLCFRWACPDYLSPLLMQAANSCMLGCSRWGLSGRQVSGRNQETLSSVEERAGFEQGQWTAIQVLLLQTGIEVLLHPETREQILWKDELKKQEMIQLGSVSKLFLWSNWNMLGCINFSLSLLWCLCAILNSSSLAT